jgi:hypothetical protein
VDVSAPPKLPTAARAELIAIAKRRRDVLREIARIESEKAERIAELKRLPTHKALAKQLGVCYQVVRRTLYGDPYVNTHPMDSAERDAAV